MAPLIYVGPFLVSILVVFICARAGYLTTSKSWILYGLACGILGVVVNLAVLAALVPLLNSYLFSVRGGLMGVVGRIQEVAIGLLIFMPMLLIISKYFVASYRTRVVQFVFPGVLYLLIYLSQMLAIHSLPGY